ncbi:hypothetical protein [Crocosphaera sp. XPORK-15E]|uniref:hypothetical protein n=1 Tax=Crocosphaera sp. XPORK-15E TaxID=3110247 RepID=UPI002B21F328|nr:hypothetical protein [Crocosphaera sp. XPORK-15E]MEA5532395.1 hypothetical protein [Crocosphaera sp. XPORK-15E]
MSIIEGGYHGYHGRRPISPLSVSNAQVDDDALYEQMKQLALCYTYPGLIRAKKTLITAGQLGTNSACSIINPGALYKDNEFHLLCRGESNDAVWYGDFLAHQGTPFWCILNQDLTIKESFALTYPTLPPNSRPEDWRLFEYQGKLYSNHSVYQLLDSQKWIIRSRPGISQIDLQNKTINLRCLLEPPFEAFNEEKNWSFFVHEGSLMCLYSFQPYIILEIDLERGTTKKVLESELNYQWYDKGKFIGNSSNMVSWDQDHYILFIHDFLDPKQEPRNRTYLQYGTLISKKTLLPTSIIPRPLQMGGDEKGRHPGVHYTSATVNQEDGLYAFYGQGDSHIGMMIFNKDSLNGLFNEYQLKKGNFTIPAYARKSLNWLWNGIKSLIKLM